jgi:hypothetical protein
MIGPVLIALLLGAGVGSTGFAQDVSFEKAYFASPAMKTEPEVVLTIANTQIEIVSKKPKEFGGLTIPFALIDTMTYEFAQRHRGAEGAREWNTSPVIGAVLMTTKTTSHWLDIHYHDETGAHIAVLQLDKTNYQRVLDTLRTHTGKQISEVNAATSDVNPTANSVNIDEALAYPVTAIAAAIKPAMADMGCIVTVEKADRIECKRPRGGSEIAGVGGEKVVATFESKGDQTRVRIETDRGFNGRMMKKNWSTPIYKRMMNKLQESAGPPA